MKGIRNFLFIAWLLCSVSCKEEVQNTYSNYPAYFVCTTVSTIPQLNAAMNNLGIFATIVYDRNRYLFTGEDGNSTPVNPTAISSHSSVHMGLSGFIVGLPNIPELGTSVSVPVCYDLACPNCYSAYNITRALRLKEGGYASCVSCGRIYNLNNQGIVSSGDAGISLFRYRIYYSGSSVTINNH